MENDSHILEQILTELRRLNDAKTTPAQEILSILQAAEYLGQSKSTLRDWVRLRKIPFSKVNGAIKFRKSKLDRWIDRNEVGMINW
jgi:excisionase family DNA binding protein